MNTSIKTKKLIINALFLAIGAILHQITPIIGLPMQPDFALAMLFIIMIINKGDYKTSLIAGLITGLFTALTTKFPGGQIPNILDKLIAINVIYIILYVIYKLPFIKGLKERAQNYVILSLILSLGTFISGITFLSLAQIIVGLPADFNTLLSSIVVPSVIINLIVGIFLFKVINISLIRTLYSYRI